MDKISVEGIHLFGYHGCLDEEGKIGTDYNIDVDVWGHLQRAAHSDELKDTLDYVVIYDIVEEEMHIRSKLIEHVADRILNKLMDKMPAVLKARIKLSKLHPPINGDVKKVSVTLERKR